MASAGPGEPGALACELLSPPGRELLGRLAAGEFSGQPVLAVSGKLRGEYPARLVAAALTQHQLRQAAQAKFNRAMGMLFTRPGLEQATSETIARYRAGRFPAGQRLADLGCGIGGDLIALAAHREVLAVDRDEALVRIAIHNAGVYGTAAGVRGCAADVRQLRLAGAGAVFTDPARRAGGRRLAAGASEPPLDWCLALAAQVALVGIKAAPGLPHALVPGGWELEFIADGRELKEAVLWSPGLATVSRRATILPGGHTMTPEPGPDVGVADPGGFLLDPNPAVTRAGLVEELARRLGAWKIDAQIAFLSADTDLRTPFARTLRVVESAPWHQARFAGRLRELGVGAADIRRRGLAGDVDQIRRHLKLDGPNRATIVLTRVGNRPWGLICTDPQL
jgi:SAM-dependent methyltransferase